MYAALVVGLVDITQHQNKRRNVTRSKSSKTSQFGRGEKYPKLQLSFSTNAITCKQCQGYYEGQ